MISAMLSVARDSSKTTTVLLPALTDISSGVKPPAEGLSHGRFSNQPRGTVAWAHDQILLRKPEILLP